MKKIKNFLTVAVFVMLVLCMFSACQNDNEKTSDAPKTAETQENPNVSEIPVFSETSEIPAVKDVVLTLYFPDGEALYLHAEERQVSVTDNENLEKVVLEELFKGPSNTDLSPSIVGEDLINSVSTDEDGLCTVDFKYDFVTLNTGGTTRENFALGSVVNSLCELENVESVKINIDGNTAPEFGHSMLEDEYKPFENLVSD